ncbi:MAG: thioesterase superfamily protein [Actinomycetia bacterium]|nr:thioesterase superfamily protein [Actinomycetes bacterium]
MTDDETLRAEAINALRYSFTATALHKLLGLRMLPTGDDVTIVEMPVGEAAFNQSGNLHGGAIATLIDVASGTMAARAANFIPGVNTVVTADLHVRYLGRPKGDTIRAEARPMRVGRQLVIIECRVLDDEENLIAFADFASMLVPKREPLKADVGGDAAAPDL